MSELNEYFKKARIKVGMSQKQLSDTLGFDAPQMVSNWERGLCKPPLESVPKLIKLLKLNQSKVVKLYLDEVKVKVEKALGIK